MDVILRLILKLPDFVQNFGFCVGGEMDELTERQSKTLLRFITAKAFDFSSKCGIL